MDSEGFKKKSHHTLHLSLSTCGNIDDEGCQVFLLLKSIYEVDELGRFAKIKQQQQYSENSIPAVNSIMLPFKLNICFSLSVYLDWE